MTIDTKEAVQLLEKAVDERIYKLREHVIERPECGAQKVIDKYEKVKNYIFQTSFAIELLEQVLLRHYNCKNWRGLDKKILVERLFENVDHKDIMLKAVSFIGALKMPDTLEGSAIHDLVPGGERIDG